MNKRKMKGTLLIAVFIISTLAIAIQVSADDIDYSLDTTAGGVKNDPVEINFADDGTLITWTIDFPDQVGNDGLKHVALIIALDGEGNGPAYQIHNDDGCDPNFEDGTWLYSPYYDGAWHSGAPDYENTLVTDPDFAWVTCSGERYSADGLYTISIDKSELGIDFHWALSLAIGSGPGLIYEYMSCPGVSMVWFNWGNPDVDMTIPNYVRAFAVTGSGSIDAPSADTTVTYEGADDDTIIIEDLTEDDVEEATFGALGEYVDVQLEEGTSITELEIRVYYPDTGDDESEEQFIMYWYDGTNWRACSYTGVVPAEDYIWAIIDDTTEPSLDQMTGTPFGPGDGMALDAEIYGTGADVEVSVGYAAANSDPNRLDLINVTATSSTDLIGILVYLTETGADTGVFTGSFSTTGEIPPPADHLVVDDGDTITVVYTEGGFSATADIDDIAPEIIITPLGGIRKDVVTDVEGTYVEPHLDTIIVNGVEATFGGGSFEALDVLLLYGNNTITAVATDLSGFTSSSSTWIVSDTLGPVVADALATPSKAIATGKTDLSVNVTDEWVDVESVTVDLTDIDGSATQGMALVEGLWEYTATVGSDIEDGVYYLNITAKDALTNEDTTGFFLFEVVTDAVPPVMGEWTVDYPTGKTTARETDVVNVTVVVTDLPAGVSHVDINGTEITVDTDFVEMDRIGTTDSYYKELTVTSDVLDGTYYLNVTATDYAGNTASTLAEVSIQELATMEMYTLSANYDPGDTVNFYVNASFAFNLDIEILDPTGFVYTTISCLGNEHWIRIGDYSIVPYQATFDLPSTAVSGTWNWTASEAGEEVANGTFTVGEVVEPQPELPAETTGEETLDSTGAPKTSFALGETVQAYSDITNVGTESQTMLIVVQFKDPAYRVFAPVFLTITLAPEQSFGYAPGLIIPPTGYTTGTWTAKIMVFDAWPALGGVPIGLPVTLSFTVTS